MTATDIHLPEKVRAPLPPRVRAALVASVADETPDPQRVEAAFTLVNWGLLDEADAALARVPAGGPLARRVGRVRMSSRYLRRSNILTDLSAVNASGIAPNAVLEGIHDALLLRRRNAGKLAIILPGAGDDFFVSLNVLYAFLRRLPTHVLFLKDTEQLLYLNGISSLGRPYDRTLASLRRIIALLGSPEILLMGCSSGGFASLWLARDLGARRVLGMSIAGDLSPTSTLPTMRYYLRPQLRAAVGSRMVDGRQILADPAYQAETVLYFGDRHPVDAAHANHLAGLPRTELRPIPAYARHDTVSALLAEGTLGQVLAAFVGEAASTEAAAE